MKDVDTNMGKMPLEDYLDIAALQYGYDSYDDLLRDGLYVDLGTEKSIG